MSNSNTLASVLVFLICFVALTNGQDSLTVSLLLFLQNSNS